MSKKSMGKSTGKKAAGKTEMTAADHRKRSETHYAQARLHSAKADLLDAKNPPKDKSRTGPYDQ